jgi:hypothetical protein
MITQSLSTQLSTEVLHFHPEGAPPTFEVTVHNTSDRFASFQLELAAAGTDASRNSDWYRVAPAVSSKIPSGARTRFQVEVLAIPPVPSGFTGTMNLTVRTFSLELPQEDRQILRLVVEGSSRLPPRLMVTSQQFQAYPEGEILIPVQVQNPNRQAVDVTVRLTGIPPAWLPEGVDKHVHLPAGHEEDIPFRCVLPPAIAAPSGDYPLTLTAEQAKTLPVTATASLMVRLQGHGVLACTPEVATLPPQPGRWLNPALGAAVYQLQFANQSNGDQTVSAVATYENPRDQRALEAFTSAAALAAAPAPAPGAGAVSPAADASLPPPRPRQALTLTPAEQTVPRGGQTTLELTVVRPLPWLGWPRRKRLQVHGAIAHPDIPLRQGDQILDLRIYPVIPFWLQVVSGAVGLVALLLLWWYLFHRGHQGTVNSLTFEGSGQELLSASDDQTLRRWRVEKGDLRGRRDLIRTDKAIRVARYRPVNNNQVWVGFENGEIQGWDLHTRRTYTLSYSRDDRVFDLALPNDGRRLISGHGSGLILDWDITPGQIPLSQTQPRQGYETNFAIQTLALAGLDQGQLMVGGRFNRLVMLDFATGTFIPLENYPSGDGNQYILDLAIAPEKPTLMAVADNQGRISLWDLGSCLPGDGPLNTTTPCRVLDNWDTGHQTRPVRSVAFSADGCYLVSGGEDGRVMLWPLSTQGTRRPDAQEGQRWRRGRQPVTAVDIQQAPRRLMVAYGLESGVVRVRSRGIQATNLPPGECAASSP